MITRSHVHAWPCKSTLVHHQFNREILVLISCTTHTHSTIVAEFIIIIIHEWCLLLFPWRCWIFFRLNLQLKLRAKKPKMWLGLAHRNKHPSYQQSHCRDSIDDLFFIFIRSLALPAPPNVPLLFLQMMHNKFWNIIYVNWQMRIINGARRTLAIAWDGKKPRFFFTS